MQTLFKSMQASAAVVAILAGISSFVFGAFVWSEKNDIIRFGSQTYSYERELTEPISMRGAVFYISPAKKWRIEWASRAFLVLAGVSVVSTISARGLSYALRR